MSYWPGKVEYGDLLALVGGPKRGQVTALQRALLYLAVCLLSNNGAATTDRQSLNVLERTDL